MARHLFATSVFSCIVFMSFSAFGFPNLTRNDPFPLYSTQYPNFYLSTRQKASLMRFDYSYMENRFWISASAYGQFADCGRNFRSETVYLGDMNGRWNMLALFYDPLLRQTLFDALGITNMEGCLCSIPAAPGSTPAQCEDFIIDPRLSDPNKEFGFFSIPLRYQKFGVRFESEVLIWDRCYYAVGLHAEWGITDLRQTIKHFNDMTGQALGQTFLATKVRGIHELVPASVGPLPYHYPVPVAPPFTQPGVLASCPDNCCGTPECPVPLQPFEPFVDEQVDLTFPATCKQFVIECIMSQSQRDKIANVLNLDIQNYHKIGIDDLRLSAFYRHIFIINEDDDRYPRSLIMPFVEFGVGIPLSPVQPADKMFALPLGNNGHTYVGGVVGLTVDFLDTIDLYFRAGFSYFFRRDFCGVHLPTDPLESGIFPYAADINVQPGPTWHANFGINAWHFLDNISFWGDYSIIGHAKDEITVCHSYIPEGSKYFRTGFDTERIEAFTKWECHLINAALNYDISDYITLGLLLQAPVRQRNVYRSTMVMGSIHFVF